MIQIKNVIYNKNSIIKIERVGNIICVIFKIGDEVKLDKIEFEFDSDAIHTFSVIKEKTK